MSDDTRDFDEAHLAYTQQRHEELTAEARENVAAFGESIGVPDLVLEDLQPEALLRIARKLAEAVRAEGHGDLADRFDRAYAEQIRALQEQSRWLMLRQERPLTAHEERQVVAADRAADEAGEHFERVQAAVMALFARPQDGDT
jgi:hypothetical protein